MSEFWAAAVVMIGVALGFFGVPLLQQRRRSGRWPLTPIVAAAAIAPLAFVLYLQVRTWTPAFAPAASPERAMVERLAARLAGNPDDVAGWRMLGRSYLELGEAASARDAYREAWGRTAQRDADLKLSLAEAEVLADRKALTGEVQILLDEVLEAEPSNPKALWYGGLAAMESGRKDVARARWSRLLTLDPPAEIVRALATQFGVTATGEPRAAVPEVASGAAPVRAQRLAAGGATSPQPAPLITLTVRLGAELAARGAGANAMLFIFARAESGGPPLAVIKRPATAAPGEFTLGDGDRMIPGRSLADFGELTVVARLSASGQPVEQPGDWYGEARTAPGSSAEIVIDRRVK